MWGCEGGMREVWYLATPSAPGELCSMLVVGVGCAHWASLFSTVPTRTTTGPPAEPQLQGHHHHYPPTSPQIPSHSLQIWPLISRDNHHWPSLSNNNNTPLHTTWLTPGEGGGEDFNRFVQCSQPQHHQTSLAGICTLRWLFYYQLYINQGGNLLTSTLPARQSHNFNKVKHNTTSIRLTLCVTPMKKILDHILTTGKRIWQPRVMRRSRPIE